MPLDTNCGDVPLTAMLPDDAESYNTLTFCVPALQLALLNRRNRTVPERFALLPVASLPLIVAVSWIVKVCSDEIFGSGFTTLAFGAFFFSLGVGTLPLLVTRDIAPAIAYARTGLVLIVVITLAALVNLHKFDFVAHPGTIIYLGTYVVAGIVAAAIVLWDWSARRGR